MSDPPDSLQTTVNGALPGRPRRGLLIGAGMLCVGLGAVGAFLPVLPTTPFLLLAAACFARSSERLHRWLLSNRLFGDYLRGYRDGEGLPLSTKLATLCLMWLSLGTSALLAVPERLGWLRAPLFAVGLGVTLHLARIKTRRVGSSRPPRPELLRDAQSTARPPAEPNG